jgi:hypothetical protein
LTGNIRYCEDNQSNEEEIGGACSTRDEVEKRIKNFGLKTLKKRPFGTPRHSCEDNIKIGPRDFGWECVDWIHLAQDRDRWRDVVKTAVNLEVS